MWQLHGDDCSKRWCHVLKCEKYHFRIYNLMSLRMLTRVLVWIMIDIINKVNNISLEISLEKILAYPCK
jgi:hypothetical protein